MWLASLCVCMWLEIHGYDRLIFDCACFCWWVNMWVCLWVCKGLILYTSQFVSTFMLLLCTAVYCSWLYVRSMFVECCGHMNLYGKARRTENWSVWTWIWKSEGNEPECEYGCWCAFCACILRVRISVFGNVCICECVYLCAKERVCAGIVLLGGREWGVTCRKLAVLLFSSLTIFSPKLF
jgi:hypothetical protein